jgi:hypothetical protein
MASVIMNGSTPIFHLRWERFAGASSYNVYKKKNAETSYTLLKNVAGNSTTDIGEASELSYYYVTIVAGGEESDGSNVVFAFHYFNYNYSKDLKAIILSKLKSNQNLVDTVGTKIEYAFQQLPTEFPCIRFQIADYSIPTGNSNLRGVAVTVRIMSREKDDFDKMKECIDVLSGFSYQSKNVKLHKLIPVGAKTEALDSDNLTWYMEFNYNGKIAINF